MGRDVRGPPHHTRPRDNQRAPWVAVQVHQITIDRVASPAICPLRRVAVGITRDDRPRHVATPIDLSCELLIASRRIDLCRVPSPGVWDRDRLGQVFSNLIGNAIHYGSPDHPVKVSCQRESESVMVDFHNRGVPIPKELLAKLFDPFRGGTRDSQTRDSQTTPKSSVLVSTFLARSHTRRWRHQRRLHQERRYDLHRTAA